MKSAKKNPKCKRERERERERERVRKRENRAEQRDTAEGKRALAG